MAEREIPTVTTPTTQSQVQPLAQVRVNTSPVAAVLGGIFSDLAEKANDSADLAAARAAQEAAALDIRNSPDGVPTLRPGTGIRAQNYNKTAKTLSLLKIDSQTTQHFLSLEEEYEGNPAGYKEATTAFLNGVLSKTDTIDPALSIRLKAKFGQIQAKGIRELTSQAEEELVAQHVDELELSSGLLIAEANRLSASIYDTSNNSEDLERMGQIFEELSANLAEGNPLTGKRYISEAEGAIQLRALQDKITFYGLVAEVRRSDDDMLEDMKNQIETQVYEILVWDEASESQLLRIPLEAVLSPERIDTLLGKINEEQRSRRAGAVKIAFGVKSAMKDRLDDGNAQVEVSGVGDPMPSGEELEAAGFTEDQIRTADNDRETAHYKYQAKSFAANARPGEMEAELERLEGLQGERGPQSAEIAKFRSELAALLPEVQKSFSGDMKDHLADVYAWVRATGEEGLMPSDKALEESGLTVDQRYTAKENYKQAKREHTAEKTVAASGPGQIEAKMKQLKEIEGGGGPLAAEARQLRSELAALLPQQLESFSGAMQDRLDNVYARVRATGEGPMPSEKVLKEAGYTLDEIRSENEKYDQAKREHAAEKGVASAVPGQTEAELELLKEIQGAEGPLASEAEKRFRALEAQRIKKENAFSGEGKGVGSNAADWMRDYLPAVQDAVIGLQHGSLSLEGYFDVLDNEYDVQQTPQHKRKYLTEEEARQLEGGFPRRDQFRDVKPEDGLGTYGEGVAQSVRNLREEFGPTGRLFSVANQLFRGDGIPLSTLTMLQIPENDIQAQNDYANALDRSPDIKAMVPLATRTRIKAEIPEAVEEFIASLVLDQSGSFKVLRGLTEGIEMVAVDATVFNSELSEEEAVAVGAKIFFGQYDFVPLTGGSILRVDRTQSYSVERLKRGANLIPQMLNRGEISALVSTFTLKEMQEVSDSTAAYATYMGRGGSLNTLSYDDNLVGVFAPDGSPALYEGKDGGIRALTFTVQELEEIGLTNTEIIVFDGTSTAVTVGATPEERQKWLEGVFDRQLQESPLLDSTLSKEPVWSPSKLSFTQEHAAQMNAAKLSEPPLPQTENGEEE